MVTFEGALKESGDQPVVVYLSTVGFRQAFDNFTACEDQLLPASFDQLQRSRIQYPVGAIELDDQAKALLRKIVQYLDVDASVQQIFVDGHTDDTGLTKDNILMSQQRAERVRDYLLDLGVSQEMLVVRYHAEKYPVVRNTSAQTRAKNRRTTIRLSREFEAQPAPESTQESAGSAVASTASEQEKTGS
jgi:outer membrane protein OmpA-like peptidoglycan-associated protein